LLKFGFAKSMSVGFLFLGPRGSMKPIMRPADVWGCNVISVIVSFENGKFGTGTPIKKKGSKTVQEMNLACGLEYVLWSIQFIWNDNPYWLRFFVRMETANQMMFDWYILPEKDQDDCHTGRKCNRKPCLFFQISWGYGRLWVITGDFYGVIAG
jgi:hypothetical protein